jgi:hypothetical protein
MLQGNLKVSKLGWRGSGKEAWRLLIDIRSDDGDVGKEDPLIFNISKYTISVDKEQLTE